MLLSWVWWEQRAGALAGGLWPWLLQPPGPTAQPVACVSPEALSAPVFPHRGSPPKDQGQGGVKVPFSYPQKLQKSKLGPGGGSQPHLTDAEPEAQSWLGGGRSRQHLHLHLLTGLQLSGPAERWGQDLGRGASVVPSSSPSQHPPRGLSALTVGQTSHQEPTSS